MKTREGKRIISAAEVGTFVVCPESWRLRELEKVRPAESERAAKGEDLHVQWATTYEEASYLSYAARIIILLVLLSVLVHLLVNR